MNERDRRRRNPRGHGDRLRADIVAAARAMLIESGSDAAVTLRGVARSAGITAPSIYAHFDTPEQIVHAVVVDVRHQLVRHLELARAPQGSARDRLVATCLAYLAFGAEQPTLYALLFTRPRLASPDRRRSDDALTPAGQAELALVLGDELAGHLVDAAAFALLVGDVSDAIIEGSSGAADPFTTSIALWVALHGLITLRSGIPRFPWPPAESFDVELITRIAVLDDEPARGGPHVTGVTPTSRH